MMLLRRTNGFHPLDQLRTQMDRLVGDFFGPMAGNYAPRTTARRAVFPRSTCGNMAITCMPKRSCPA